MIETAALDGIGKIDSLPPCPACENVAFQMRFIKNSRRFWRCRSCGLEKIHPLPTLEDLRKYYDESYSAGMYKTFVAAAEMKRLTAGKRFEDIRPQVRPGRWLDVGCSNGVFVRAARERGMDAEGIDLSRVATDSGRREGLPLHCSTLEDFDPGYRYDTVTAFDILEHVLDPLGFMRSIRRLLAPDGRVVLTLPDAASLSCRLMGPRWYFYIPEEHLHYFHPASLANLLRRAGFRIQRCARAYKPLNFSYALTQFEEYNPLIFALLNPLARATPRPLRDMILPLYIGEMLAVAGSAPETAS
jgi:2-polyprenyl-3-methyl-5-hydroxy-6-metoxy-1,4-benzoquinol methylase